MSTPVPTGSKISITFDMNKLQDIPLPGEPGSPGRVLVTMNPIRTPRNLQSSKVYYHPLIASESIVMSRYLDKINGVDNVSFAGAWMGFGFHEDGFAAGAHVAKTLINGRENTGPLDLVARVQEIRGRKVGFSRSMLKMGVSIVQYFLVDDKIAF
jgi:predicted NAD/FAD-binding protein